MHVFVTKTGDAMSIPPPPPKKKPFLAAGLYWSMFGVGLFNLLAFSESPVPNWSDDDGKRRNPIQIDMKS